MACCLIGFSYVGSRNKQYKYVVIGLGCYALVMGLRYNVGIDYLAYFDMFKKATLNVFLTDLERTEYGFKQFTKIIAKTSSSILYFSIIAFFQVFFYFYILKNKPKTWVYIAFSFVTICTWLSFANTLRQFLSAGLIMYSLVFIVKGKPFKFLACIIIATLFHKISIIFLILYPVFRYKFKNIINRYWAICIIIICVYLSSINILTEYLTLFESAASLLNYDSYINGEGGKYMAVKVNKGFGFYLLLLMNMIIVWYSKKINKFYNDRLVTILYYLFFIGTCLGYITLQNQMFSRIAIFVSSCNFVLYGLVLYYLTNTNKKLYYTLLIPPIVLFLGTIIKADSLTNGSAYFRIIFDYT